MTRSFRHLAYSAEAIIRRSPEGVFAFCSDLRNELRWNPRARCVEKLTDGRVAVGTRFRAQWSNTGSVDVEVLQFDPPRLWETRSSARGMDVRFRGTVEPPPSRARYTAHLEVQPSGLARLYAPLALIAMRRQEGENMQRIKAVLEVTACSDGSWSCS